MAMKLRSRTLEWLVAAGAVLLCKVLFRTLRIRQITAREQSNPFSESCQEAFIYAVWHDQLLTALFAGRHRRTVALVSKHQDGSYLARALKMVGVGAVRGSSSRGGAGAMRELLKLPPLMNVVITPDGPRGPRRRVKAGVAFLGSHTGRAIVPTAFACTRSWKVPGSWSDLLIPKPFAVLYAIAGEPIQAPSNLDPAGRSAVDRLLQEQMEILGRYAESLALGLENASSAKPMFAKLRTLRSSAQPAADANVS
jgi:lysophospholipid acyltransferase (LPLAT)-like uncharacterized protein